jgi:hypothetical protein
MIVTYAVLVSSGFTGTHAGLVDAVKNDDICPRLDNAPGQLA